MASPARQKEIIVEAMAHQRGVSVSKLGAVPKREWLSYDAALRILDMTPTEGESSTNAWEFRRRLIDRMGGSRQDITTVAPLVLSAGAGSALVPITQREDNMAVQLPKNLQMLMAGAQFMAKTQNAVVSKSVARTGNFGQQVQGFIKEHPIIAGLGAVGIGTALGVGAAKLFGGDSGMGRRRRIDPGNTRALRRAISRVNSYSRLNRSVEKSIKKAARLVS